VAGLLAYAERVTREPWAVTDADVAALRTLGYGDAAILEATHVIGFFNHINRLADALHVELEPGMPPAPTAPPAAGAERRSLAEFQRAIADIFGARDRARGLARNFMWFTEEVGELSRALSAQSPERQAAEFADVLAWLCTLADEAGIDLATAAWARYGRGCPRCGRTPCACPERARG
jgi:NTP pyrophosphatase (non-canonical NTP hydrolase)